MMECIKCGLQPNGYGLRAKDGRLWTIAEIEEFDESGSKTFDMFSEEVYDKMEWIKIKINKRNGSHYCERCEHELFSEDMRIEQIIAKREAHEQRTGQLAMFPGLE